MNQLEFNSVSVGYNSNSLHEPFSFSFMEGEIISLIGPNGSGKTTILKTLIKELPPVEGKIVLSGKDLNDFSQKNLAKNISALLTVPVKPELMSCYDVVSGGRYPYTGHFGNLNDEDKSQIESAIKLVKAEEFALKNFMEVSDGQKQRILFARALCQNPKILVLDEPTSFLDIHWRLELFKILKNLSKKGITIMLSLHELDLALKISDKILCTGKNKITYLSKQEGECKNQIKELYELNDVFFEEEPVYSELIKKFCENLTAEPVIEKNSFSGNSIMVQGTMSNSGKSFITAGLCRIFVQDGFSVAPFKSQNMALNSYITDEGLEMGRAQAMQAEACGIEPSVLMNPVLLKPVTDVGSQVIVKGEVMKNMSARDYFSFKKTLVPVIKESYEKLAEEHEIIVLEGAGSPAEINLRENDIVNMGMAELSDSPVLLVADIDRGGVFAQLVGTLELLTVNERSRIKGLIINKFRGDKSILDSGIKILEEKTGIPVLGCVPYIKITLDDEDSLSENLNILTKFQADSGKIQIAVIKLPHISNFTDFIPLQNLSDVNIYYVSKPEDLGFPDAIIIPGTKNTFKDLEWLKESGLADKIKDLAQKRIQILGICGGFQILGECISGTESEGEEQKKEGLSLLPVETVFSKQKTRTRVSGLTSDGIPVSGYEIHMGETKFVNENTGAYFSEISDSISGKSKKEGAVKENVSGTYIHGIFDEFDFTESFVKKLAKVKGIEIQEIERNENFKESQYNLLADTLRENLDINKIYKIMGIKKDI
ncbi:cobyric acid synthase [Treponema sp.]|uniref:cobyric acid synthase n=1 Tax=Treponema sp. TaxID=166 RepID=UPI003890BB36